MTGKVLSAEQVLLKDRRLDATRSLSDLRERLELEMGANPVLASALSEVLRGVVDVQERVSAWCPALFGPNTPQFDEQCCCWMCDFSDPFEGRDDPG